MLPLAYTLRPRRSISLAGLGAVLFGFAVAWWNPLVGLLIGGGSLVFTVLGVLPYYLWRHHLLVAEDHVALPAGWAWSRRVARLPYRDLSHVRGLLSAEDTVITFADRNDREYSINADLLPSRADFELVIHAVLERVRSPGA